MLYLPWFVVGVMAIFVPFLGFLGSSVFLNYQASQQLEHVGRDVRFTRMFWPPFSLGLLLGVWVGVSMGPRILGTIELFENWFVWFWGIKQKPPHVGDQRISSSSNT